MDEKCIVTSSVSYMRPVVGSTTQTGVSHLDTSSGIEGHPGIGLNQQNTSILGGGKFSVSATGVLKPLTSGPSHIGPSNLMQEKEKKISGPHNVTSPMVQTAIPGQRQGIYRTGYGRSKVMAIGSQRKHQIQHNISLGNQNLLIPSRTAGQGFRKGGILQSEQRLNLNSGSCIVDEVDMSQGLA